jgi:hypothetical protein
VLVPTLRAGAARRRRANGVVAEADVGGGCGDAAALHQRGELLAGMVRPGAGIEIERNAGVEMDASEDARQRPFVGGQTVVVGADPAGEDESEGGRAVLEIVQRLGIGCGRVGMIDALHDPPGRAGGAPGNRPCVRLAAVKRLDGQTVIGLGDEPGVEGRALEHAFDQPAPLVARSGGKLRSQRQVVGGGGHAHRLPRCKWWANSWCGQLLVHERQRSASGPGWRR